MNIVAVLIFTPLVIALWAMVLYLVVMLVTMLWEDFH